MKIEYTKELLEYKDHIKDIQLQELISMSNNIDRKRFPEKYTIMLERIKELENYKRYHIDTMPLEKIKLPWYFVLKCWWWNIWRKSFAHVIVIMLSCIILLPIIYFAGRSFQNLTNYKILIFAIMIFLGVLLYFYIDYFVFKKFLKSNVDNYLITIADSNNKIADPLPPKIELKFWWWRNWRLYLIFFIVILTSIVIAVSIKSLNESYRRLIIRTISYFSFTIINIYMYHRVLNAQVDGYCIRTIISSSLIPKDSSTRNIESEENFNATNLKIKRKITKSINNLIS